MGYVNIHGQEITDRYLAAQREAAAQKPKKAKPQRDSYHNGWRVQGIPPGALEEARRQCDLDAAACRHAGKEPKAWDEESWLMNAKRKPVRNKPYEVPQAAQECAALAIKSGWLRVEVVELKKEGA